MSTERRARQKANRARKVEHEQKLERRDQWRQYLTIGALVAIGVAVAVYLISLGGNDADTASSSSTTAASSTSTTASPEIEPSAVSTPEPGGSIEGTPECPAADGSSERITSFAEAPPSCIDASAAYTAELDTTAGTIVIELDPAAAPETVNNFVFLARYHYYDGSPFHRIIPGFVIQGGDAVGDPIGTGDPGYLIGEEPPEPGAYEVGSVAMAKGEPSETTGSQFFIVTGPQGASLPNEYSLFGTVAEGIEVVEAIEAIPTNVNDNPTEEIYINSVTITEA